MQKYFFHEAFPFFFIEDCENSLKIFDRKATAFHFKQMVYLYSFEQLCILLLIVIVLINFLHILVQIKAYC